MQTIAAQSVGMSGFAIEELVQEIFLSVIARVHNTLQRVSNANYHCTNTLGKVT